MDTDIVNLINYDTDKQANFVLTAFSFPTTLFSFEQLIHLDYSILRRVVWCRGGFLVASWLVAKPPGGEMTGYRDKGSRQ